SDVAVHGSAAGSGYAQLVCPRTRPFVCVPGSGDLLSPCGRPEGHQKAAVANTAPAPVTGACTALGASWHSERSFRRMERPTGMFDQGRLQAGDRACRSLRQDNAAHLAPYRCNLAHAEGRTCVGGRWLPLDVAANG